MKITAIYSIVAFIVAYGITQGQDNFYDISTIQTIEIEFGFENWDYRLDTAKHGSDGYTMAQKVIINGISFDSVGVKFKGNSSYDSTYIKNPFTIALDEYKNQTYQGYKTLKLANCFADPSMIREVLSYQIVKNYIDAPKANFAKIIVNKKPLGLYSNVESINKSFCSSRYGSSKGAFFSCSPTVKPTPQTKSNLLYLDTKDSTAYMKYYEIKSDAGWAELITLCDSLTNNPGSITRVMDIERVLWMLAINTVMVNLDSYTGVFSQNYYLYRDGEQYWNVIPWDYNMSFGGFPFLGASNTSMGTLSLTGLQNLSVTAHSSDKYWTLISAVMNDADLKKRYMAHCKTLVEEIFANGQYIVMAETLRTLINEEVKNDTHKFYSDEQFTASMNTGVNIGNYAVPGIIELMSARVNYLQQLPEILAPSPTVIIEPINNPVLQSTVNVKVTTISNDAVKKVELHLRFNEYSHFETIPMYDDGAHNDGAANDGQYGCEFVMKDNIVHYYVYAANEATGRYVPSRSSKEYFMAKAKTGSAIKGDVVVNEFLASNSAGAQNEQDEYADWIELFNNTTSDIDLAGFTLSDDINKPTKFTFPAESIIPAKGYLAVWADENKTTDEYIHVNFKLSASGETILLRTGEGITLDSVVFEAQEADISLGRCPDGVGAFVTMMQPTFFKTNNCLSNIAEHNEAITSVYPQPADKVLHITFAQSLPESISLLSMLGEEIAIYPAQQVLEINTSHLANGHYYLKAGNQILRLVILHE